MESLSEKSLSEKSLSEKYKHIKGWGVDADPENDPTYPMKNYTGDDHARLNYERPPMQESQVEILHSNERPGITAVYGTSTPPSGLSGKIRRYAFRYSEGSFGHWLPLLLADRVNMVEGIIDDIRNGIFPNVFAERGWNAEWKYNKKGVAKKVVVAAAILTVAYLVLVRRKRKA
jgi:hypothetical protein